MRGYTWTVVPISWRNRRHGTAKLKLKEMGSRYFFICAYVWLEKHFSRGGDYRRADQTPGTRPSASDRYTQIAPVSDLLRTTASQGRRISRWSRVSTQCRPAKYRSGLACVARLEQWSLFGVGALSYPHFGFVSRPAAVWASGSKKEALFSDLEVRPRPRGLLRSILDPLLGKLLQLVLLSCLWVDHSSRSQGSESG